MPEAVPESLSHEAKVILYVIGLANDLVNQGLMAGGPPMTPAGRAAYEALRDSGFRPTTTEIQEVYHYSGLFDTLTGGGIS